MTTTQKHQVTSITETGVAFAEYDIVTFTINIQGTGKTNVSAKENARPVIDAVNAVLDRFEASGVKFEKDSRKTFPGGTGPTTRYDNKNKKHVKTGRYANYTICASCLDVHETSEIYDALTEIDRANVQDADFKVRDLAALHEDAVKDANAKVNASFASQCAILGLNPDNYKLLTWNVRKNYSESAGNRSAQAFAASARRVEDDAPEPVEINPGKAQVEATLTIGYAEKSKKNVATKIVPGPGGRQVVTRDGVAIGAQG